MAASSYAFLTLIVFAFVAAIVAGANRRAADRLGARRGEWLAESQRSGTGRVS